MSVLLAFQFVWLSILTSTELAGFHEGFDTLPTHQAVVIDSGFNKASAGKNQRDRNPVSGDDGEDAGPIYAIANTLPFNRQTPYTETRPAKNSFDTFQPPIRAPPL